MKDGVEKTEKHIKFGNNTKDDALEQQFHHREHLRGIIKKLKAQLLNEDQILSLEKKSKVRHLIDEFTNSYDILEAKIDGQFFDKNNALTLNMDQQDSFESDKMKSLGKKKFYTDLKELLDLSTYSGADK